MSRGQVVLDVEPTPAVKQWISTKTGIEVSVSRLVVEHQERGRCNMT